MLLAIAAVASISNAQEPLPKIDFLEIKTKDSLIHLGSLDSYDRTEGGTSAAKLLIQAIEEGDKDAARRAVEIYKQIIPNENFGGEYTALQWMCEYLYATPAERKKLLNNGDLYTASYYEFWAENNYERLKEYIRTKYKLAKPTNKKDTPTEETEAKIRQRFLEDFILFNNPRRETWEKTSQFIQKIGLKKGDHVVDFGCGPGYFTFKFSKIVGPTGKVAAMDLNPEHLKYLRDLIKKSETTESPIKNVEVSEAAIPNNFEADCIFLCSLYHVLYCGLTEEELAIDVLNPIKRTLKPKGQLIVIDNSLIETKVDGKRLPYHGPHIAKELIIAQLEHSGFVHKATYDKIIPQRYMLVFERDENFDAKPKPHGKAPEGSIAVESSASLLKYHNPSQPFQFSMEGRRIARDFYAALMQNDKYKAKLARDQYLKIIPKERIGCEYLAFTWICDYIIASPEEKKNMLKDPLVKDYFDRIGGDDFTIVKKYVNAWFMLDTSDAAYLSRDASKFILPNQSNDDIFDWHETIVFNNPRRELWEKSSEMLNCLNLQPGQSVADVGCGHGYFTFKFTDKVGPKGTVYGLETNQTVLNEFTELAKKHHFDTVKPLKSTYDNCKLPENSVDMLFLCSMYHAVYLTSIDFVRERFIESMKKALRKNGRLVIVDNEMDTGTAPPYYGPRIDRRLIIEQLKHFGFKLVDQKQFIPQRYMLFFELDPSVKK